MDASGQWLQTITEHTPYGLVTCQLLWHSDGSIRQLIPLYSNEQTLLLSGSTETVFLQSLLTNPKSAEQLAQVVRTGEARTWEHYLENRQRWIRQTATRLADDQLLLTLADHPIARPAPQSLAASSGGIRTGPLDPIRAGVAFYEARLNTAGQLIDFQFRPHNQALIDTRIRTTGGAGESTHFPVHTDWFAGMRKAYQNGQRQEFEWMDHSSRMIFQVVIDKFSDGVLCTVIDVTRYKQIEDQKRRQADMLNRIIQNSPSGIVLCEPVYDGEQVVTDFRYKLVNQVTCDVMNRPANEMVGKTPGEVLPDTAPLFLERLLRVHRTGQSERYETHNTSGGLNVWADVILVRQENDILVVFQNITALKQTQLQLETTIAQLREAQRKMEADVVRLQVAEQEIERSLHREREVNMLKTQFVSLASHQFRTPLTSILLKAELLEKYSQRAGDEAPTLTKRMTEYARQIRRDVQRIDSLINDVLMQERMQLGQISLRSVRLDLVAFCQRQIRQQQQREPAYHRVRFQTVLDALWIEADPILLEHILENLLNNALKYSEQSDKPIEMELTASASQLQLTIQDYGIGIPPDDLKRMGESFFRAGNAAAIAGTGLGFSLSRRFAELHGGRLEVESELDHYTICRVLLPIVSPADQNRRNG